MEGTGAITLQPIGRVSNSVKEVRPMKGAWHDIVSEIVLDEEYADGLSELAGFSHILVVYWMHKVGPDKRTAAKARLRGDGPEVGTFALRTPNRPNPIGVSTVRMQGIRGKTLNVVGLDAVDGTPILDIKPYSLRHDLAKEVRLPEWTRSLW